MIHRETPYIKTRLIVNWGLGGVGGGGGGGNPPISLGLEAYWVFSCRAIVFCLYDYYLLLRSYLAQVFIVGYLHCSIVV